MSRAFLVLELALLAASVDGLRLRVISRPRAHLNMGALWDGPSKYGLDPRDGLDQYKAQMRTTSLPGVINSLGSIETLQCALDSSPIVVLKFLRKGCAACASTAERYEAAAAEYHDSARFFTVDFNEARMFCRQCKLKVVPAVHIYRDGTLRAAMALGSSSWEAFATQLAEWVTLDAEGEQTMDASDKERVAAVEAALPMRVERLQSHELL
jgi:thiol-disulfide isomerase/thioredoxin